MALRFQFYFLKCLIRSIEMFLPSNPPLVQLICVPIISVVGPAVGQHPYLHQDTRVTIFQEPK